MRPPMMGNRGPGGPFPGGRPDKGPARTLAELSVTVWLTPENATFYIKNDFLHIKTDSYEGRAHLCRQFPFELEWEFISVMNDEQAEVIYPGSQISAEIKTTYSVGDDYILGDVNGDGVVNISDATEIQKYAVGRMNLTEAQLVSGDVNGDGVVNISDATDIQKYAVGKLVF